MQTFTKIIHMEKNYGYISNKNNTDKIGLKLQIVGIVFNRIPFFTPSLTCVLPVIQPESRVAKSRPGCGCFVFNETKSIIPIVASCLIRVKANPNSEGSCKATESLVCCGSGSRIEVSSTNSCCSESSIGPNSSLKIGYFQIVPKSYIPGFFRE